MLTTVQAPHKQSSSKYGFGMDDADQYFYGTEFRDNFLFHDPASLPRFGHLARKALHYYAGDRYNPHEHGLLHEPFLRGIFKELISRKILYRAKAYDWHWIDQMLKRYIGNSFNIHLPYDEAYIEQGYKVDGKTAIQLDMSVKH